MPVKKAPEKMELGSAYENVVEADVSDLKDGHCPGSLTRLDSGVEDVDSGTGSSIQMRSLADQTPKQYEYDYAINRPSHFYEELPRLSQNDVRVAYQPNECYGELSLDLLPSPCSVDALINCSETETPKFVTDAMLRKRQNPLYQGIVERYPTWDSQDTTDKQTRQHICNLYIIMSCCLLLTLVSISLSFYLLTNQLTTKGMESNTHANTPELSEVKNLPSSNKQLKNDDAKLQDKTKELQHTPSLSENSNGISLLRQLKTLSRNLTVMQDYMTSELQKISTLAGAKSGFNLSACHFLNVTDKLAGPSNIQTHATNWLPNKQKLKENLVIGGGCSVQGGTYHSLSSRVLKSGHRQYQCSCGGQTLYSKYRHCTIYLWICPV